MIPKINEVPEVKAAGEKLQKLKDELKEVEGQLTNYQYRPNVPTGETAPLPIAEAAAKYLAGEKLEDLQTFSADILREKLVHRMKILREAVQQQENHFNQCYRLAAIEAAAAAEPFLHDICCDVLEKLGALVEALDKQNEHFAYLGFRGVQPMYRPGGHFDELPFEHWILSNYQNYVNTRKAGWQMTEL